MEGGGREGRHAAEHLVCGGRTSCGTRSCTREVSYNAIGDQGLPELTKALVHCPTRKMLGLVNNGIMDEGREHLAAVLELNVGQEVVGLSINSGGSAGVAGAVQERPAEEPLHAGEPDRRGRAGCGDGCAGDAVRGAAAGCAAAGARTRLVGRCWLAALGKYLGTEVLLLAHNAHRRTALYYPRIES